MANARNAKATAAAGLVTMLLGALLVWAPGAGAGHTEPKPTVTGGNPSCPSDTVEFKFDSPFETSGDSDTRDIVLPGDDDATSVTISYTGSGADPIHYSWTSSHGVDAVIVKQGSSAATFSYDGALGGTVYVAMQEGDSASTNDTSHMTFCLAGATTTTTSSSTTSTTTTTTTTTTTQPETQTTTTTTTVAPELASLQVVKAVEGADVPGEWAFDFTGDLGSFTLNDTAVSNTEVDLEAGSYTVTEVDDGDADLTDISCTGATATPDLGAGSVTVELAEGDDAQCTFTNVFPQVLDETVVEAEPQPEPETEVLDEETTPTTEAPEVLQETEDREMDTLPRTGSGTQHLAGVGIALLAFGAVLVAGSGRRLASLH